MTTLQKLKIGFVLDDGLDKPDGVQQYILAIGDWLQSQGHEVHYLVGQTSRTDIVGVHSMSRNVRVRFNGNRLTMPLPTSKRRLRKFLQSEQFDILHVQVPYSPFMGHQLIMTAEQSQTAIVGTFHIAPNNRLVSLGNRGLGLWLHSSLKRFDTMLSVSPAAADFARRTFGMVSEILPNVIDYQRFHTAQPLEQYTGNRLTVLFLGRLVPRKGCLLLLKAVTELARRPGLPDFRVIICGTGPLERQLRRHIADYHLENIVELVGFVTEKAKPRYYASADISVFPSSGGESFGIVLLEAMASGQAAILAGDNPGYRSVVGSKPELLFDSRNASELTVRLETYLQDTNKRREIQRWGAEFTKQFDVTVVGRKLLDVYVEALHKRRNP
jgi:phosphatidyl-myo-inositol alpha-mannosyltransferase